MTPMTRKIDQKLDVAFSQMMTRKLAIASRTLLCRQVYLSS